MRFWVFGDHRNYYQDRVTLQILAKARTLAEAVSGEVTVVLLGHEADEFAREYLAHGAHKVILVDDPRLSVYSSDLYTNVLTSLAQEYTPDYFFIAASQFGREIAPRLAKRLHVGLCADCFDFRLQEKSGEIRAVSPAYGGGWLAEIAWRSNSPRMATVISGIFDELPHDDSAQGEIIRKPLPPNIDQAIDQRMKLISSSREPHQQRSLEKAKTVIAGGRGMKSKEGFHLVRELAMVLGGEVGATRPAVDSHWTATENLIGQTGKSIKPRLFICGGASGAVQFTAGVDRSSLFVAVNRDAGAFIFKRADIGIVADAAQFFNALIKEIKKFQFYQLTELYRAGISADEAPLEQTFGGRIRKLREDRSLSLASLAEQAGSTPEYLNQVESCEITPPVSFLLQLSQALDIDPTGFLTDREKAQIGAKREEGYVKRTQNYSYQTLTPGAADKHLRAFLVGIEPKERHKMVEYKHPGEEFIYVLEGELEVTLDAKVHRLRPGETIHFNSETPHKLRNLSNNRCDLIVVLYTP